MVHLKLQKGSRRGQNRHETKGVQRFAIPPVVGSCNCSRDLREVRSLLIDWAFHRRTNAIKGKLVTLSSIRIDRAPVWPVRNHWRLLCEPTEAHVLIPSKHRIQPPPAAKSSFSCWPPNSEEKLSLTPYLLLLRGHFPQLLQTASQACGSRTQPDPPFDPASTRHACLPSG